MILGVSQSKTNQTVIKYGDTIYSWLHSVWKRGYRLVGIGHSISLFSSKYAKWNSYIWIIKTATSCKRFCIVVLVITFFKWMIYISFVKFLLTCCSIHFLFLCKPTFWNSPFYHIIINLVIKNYVFESEFLQFIIILAIWKLFVMNQQCYKIRFDIFFNCWELMV